MRKLMLLAAMVAMVLVAAVPAFAHATVVSDDDNVVDADQTLVAVGVQVNTGDANAASDDGIASASISQDLSIDQNAVQNAAAGTDINQTGVAGDLLLFDDSFFVFWF